MCSICKAEDAAWADQMAPESLLEQRRNASSAVEQAKRELETAQSRLEDALRQQSGTYELSDLSMGSKSVLLPVSDLRMSSAGIMYIHPNSSLGGSYYYAPNQLMEVSRTDDETEPFKQSTRLSVVLPYGVDPQCFRPGSRIASGFDGIDQGWNRVSSITVEGA